MFARYLRTEESFDPPPAACTTGVFETRPAAVRNRKLGMLTRPERLRAWTQAPEVERAGSALRGEIRRVAKMLLDLSEEHKEHLSFLPQVDCAG